MPTPEQFDEYAKQAAELTPKAENQLETIRKLAAMQNKIQEMESRAADPSTAFDKLNLYQQVERMRGVVKNLCHRMQWQEQTIMELRTQLHYLHRHEHAHGRVLIEMDATAHQSLGTMATAKEPEKDYL